MANVLNLLSEETFAEKMDTQNVLLAAIASQNGGIAITSWADVQKLVRMGLASKVFTIGDQLTCQRGSTTLVWDIIGIDHDTPTDKTKEHSLTLQLHDCLAGVQFDAREALYYAESELAAGTYNFYIVSQPWYTADNGKTFQFTLSTAVPAGGQIVLDMTYNAALAGRSVKTYASNTSSDVIETATISEGSGGTALGTTDGSVDNLNHIQRAIMGSNNWMQSAIRQYLNSSAAAGSVWTPKTNFDRPPSWATNTAGLLNTMDEDFLAVIGEVDKITTLNTITDGGGSETNAEKFFLLSRSEVYGGNENGILEGAAYPYYVNNSDFSSPTTEKDTNRIKYRNGAAQYWWLRSPYTSYSYGVRTVGTTGNVNHSSAHISCGVAPACCII